MATIARAQITLTGVRDGTGSYTFFRYSDDGGNSFTEPKPWVETGDYGNGRNLYSRARYSVYNGAKVLADMFYAAEAGYLAGIYFKANLFTVGKEYAVSFDFLPKTECRIGGHSAQYNVKAIHIDGLAYSFSWPVGLKTPLETGKSHHVELVVERKPDAAGADNNLYIQPLRGGGSKGSWEIRNVKLEEGNAATEWTPAPEDQQFGLTPDAWLGVATWDKPYPPMEESAYSWSEVKGKDGLPGRDGADGNDGHPAEFYRLVPIAEKATVDGSGKLTANLSYQIEHVTGADFAVRYSAADGYRIRYRGDTGTPANTLMSYGSTSSAIYMLENYSHVPHPDYLIVELVDAEDAVLDRRTVPVTFSTMAALDINGQVGEISARVQGMAVGGRNLLRATAFEPADWGDVTGRIIPPGSIDTEITHGGHNSVRVQMSGAAGDTYQGAKWLAVEVEPGAQYVASVWAYTPDVEAIDHGAYIELKYKDAGGASQRMAFESMVPSVSGVWERFSTVFTVPVGVRVTECNFWLTRNGSLYLAEPMIERGNLLTDWMPAPEDAEAYLAEVNVSIGKVDTSVTDLKTGLEASGVHLDTNGITLKGDTKIIDSDGHETALFEDGKITAEHINADNIEANGVKINGTVTAEGGQIGPFYICGPEGQKLPDGSMGYDALIAQGLSGSGAANYQMRLSLTLIEFLDRISNKSIRLGNSTISGVVGIGDALIHISAPYALERPDYGLNNFNAAIAISKGCSVGIRRRTVRVVNSAMLDWTCNNVICYNTAEIRLYLPEDAEDGQDYFIRLKNDYKVTVYSASGQHINARDAMGDATDTSVVLPFKKNLINENITITSAYLLYDGYDKRWYCQFMI